MIGLLSISLAACICSLEACGLPNHEGLELKTTRSTLGLAEHRYVQNESQKSSFSGNQQEREKMEEKQTLAVNTEGSRDHSSSKVTAFCVLFAITYMNVMHFSLSIAIHLGLEKNSKLIFLGCEHMQTMMQILICSTAFLSKWLHFRRVFHEPTAISTLEFSP